MTLEVFLLLRDGFLCMAKTITKPAESSDAPPYLGCISGDFLLMTQRYQLFLNDGAIQAPGGV